MSDKGYEWIEEDDHLSTSLVPRFTSDLDIGVIEQLVRGFSITSLSESCKVEFLAQGSFNKVYKTITGSTESVFRVSMPIEAPYKIQSEVATAQFIGSKTSLPIPRIHAFDATTSNPLHYPWIAMEHSTGSSLNECWFTMEDDKKENLIKQIAQAHAKLFEEKFQGIGSLFASVDGDSDSPQSSKIEVGRFLGVISLRFDEQFNRDPYQNSFEWLMARVAQIQRNISKLYPNLENLEGTEETLRLLSKAIPLLFVTQGTEDTYISIHDLHGGNILVDESGDLTAVIDWEFIVVEPAWSACDIPCFLITDRCTQPLPRDRCGDQETFEEHQRAYETTTKYLPMFEQEMKRLSPEWHEHYQSSESKKRIRNIIENLEHGDYIYEDDEEWLRELVG